MSLERFYERLAGGRAVTARGVVPAHKGADAPVSQKAEKEGPVAAPSARTPAGRHTRTPTITTPMVALAWQIAEHPERHRAEARALARLVLETTGDIDTAARP